jgi:hypothetical protein
MKSFEGNKDLAKKFVLLMIKGRNHFSSSQKRDFIRKMLLTNLHKVRQFQRSKTLGISYTKSFFRLQKDVFKQFCIDSNLKYSELPMIDMCDSSRVMSVYAWMTNFVLLDTWRYDKTQGHTILQTDKKIIV